MLMCSQTFLGGHRSLTGSGVASINFFIYLFIFFGGGQDPQKVIDFDHSGGQDPQKVIDFHHFVQGNYHFFLDFTQSWGQDNLGGPLATPGTATANWWML